MSSLRSLCFLFSLSLVSALGKQALRQDPKVSPAQGLGGERAFVPDLYVVVHTEQRQFLAGLHHVEQTLGQQKPAVGVESRFAR